MDHLGSRFGLSLQGLSKGPMRPLTINSSMSLMPECWRSKIRPCYKSFGINMTTEKSLMPNLDTYLVLMPQVLVGAGCPQGPASTCCAFQPIIYPKVQQVHTLIFDASSNGIWLDLKQGTGVGQPLKTCIHSKHESTSNQPTERNKKSFKEIPLSSLLFHLAMARHSPCGCLKQDSKSEEPT